VLVAGVVRRLHSTRAEGDVIFLMNTRMFFRSIILKSQPRHGHSQLKIHLSLSIISYWQSEFYHPMCPAELEQVPLKLFDSF